MIAADVSADIVEYFGRRQTQPHFDLGHLKWPRLSVGHGLLPMLTYTAPLTQSPIKAELRTWWETWVRNPWGSRSGLGVLGRKLDEDPGMGLKPKPWFPTQHVGPYSSLGLSFHLWRLNWLIYEDLSGAKVLYCNQAVCKEQSTVVKASQTLFSLCIYAPENDRWRDLDRKCPLQIDQPSASIWECLPEKCQDGSLWHQEAVTACAVTSLIKDLNINDHNGNPSAPPSKRQCRSLSFSDEMSSCRTSWRPLGSKVWTPVEKRRCYSGGSVQRYSNGVSPMQRSSSFSLPARANGLSSPCHQSSLHHRFGGQPCRGAPGSAPCGRVEDSWSPDPHPVGGGRLDLQRSLSCSHEQFSFPEYCPPSANSTPASTPELARRSSGLARSRSQPCVLNDKKIGVKRRRPDEVQEQRPSLDLAKMAQVSAPVA